MWEHYKDTERERRKRENGKLTTSLISSSYANLIIIICCIEQSVQQPISFSSYPQCCRNSILAIFLYVCFG